VRVLCRSPFRADHLIDLGVQVIKGSLFEPDRLTLFLREALASFIATPLLENPADEVKLGRTVAEAHLGSTIDHVVYLSVFGVAAGAKETSGRAEPGPAARRAVVSAKAEFEQQLADTGIDCSFLRTAFLMENLSLLWGEIEGGTLALPAPVDAPFPLVAASDVASTALMALARGPAGAESMNLVAPDVLTPEEMALVLAEALGHEVEAVEVSEREYAQRLERSGVPSNRAVHIADLAGHMVRCGDTARAEAEHAEPGTAGVTNVSFASFAHELTGIRSTPPPARAYLTF
jgi:uncharacterized protein YbjT (DUF2867 family)